MTKKQKTILLEVKSAYGRSLVYPRCSVGQLLAELAGHKTFTDTDLKTIKALGYEIKWHAPSVDI